MKFTAKWLLIWMLFVEATATPAETTTTTKNEIYKIAFSHSLHLSLSLFKMYKNAFCPWTKFSSNKFINKAASTESKIRINHICIIYILLSVAAERLQRASGIIRSARRICFGTLCCRVLLYIQHNKTLVDTHQEFISQKVVKHTPGIFVFRWNNNLFIIILITKLYFCVSKRRVNMIHVYYTYIYMYTSKDTCIHLR